MEIDRRRTETSYLTFLSLSLYLSLPLTPLLSFTLSCSLSAVYLFLSLLCLVSQISIFFSFTLALFLFVLLYICSVELNQTHASYVRRLLLFCFVSYILAPSSLFPFLLFLTFHTAETMHFKCPDATTCKLSETLQRTLSKA